MRWIVLVSCLTSLVSRPSFAEEVPFFIRYEVLQPAEGSFDAQRAQVIFRRIVYAGGRVRTFDRKGREHPSTIIPPASFKTLEDLVLTGGILDLPNTYLDEDEEAQARGYVPAEPSSRLFWVEIRALGLEKRILYNEASDIPPRLRQLEEQVLGERAELLR